MICCPTPAGDPRYYMAIGTSGNQFKNAGPAGRLMSELIEAIENGRAPGLAARSGRGPQNLKASCHIIMAHHMNIPSPISSFIAPAGARRHDHDADPLQFQLNRIPNPTDINTATFSRLRSELGTSGTIMG